MGRLEGLEVQPVSESGRTAGRAPVVEVHALVSGFPGVLSLALLVAGQRRTEHLKGHQVQRQAHMPSAQGALDGAAHLIGVNDFLEQPQPFLGGGREQAVVDLLLPVGGVLLQGLCQYRESLGVQEIGDGWWGDHGTPMW